MPDAVSAPSVRAGERKIPPVKRGWEGALDLIRVFALYSPFHQPVITSLAILAIIGCTEACLKGNPPTLCPTMEITWKTGQFHFHPLSFKLHVELITTCEMSELKFYVIHKLDCQWPK